MYVDPNFKHKKQLKEAVAQGRKVYIYAPGIQQHGPLTGTFSVEGPHYPAAHTWYAKIRVEEGLVVEVLA